MKEAQFATKIGKKIPEIFKDDKSITIEYKVSNGGTFNLKQWRAKQGHQGRNLINSKRDAGVYYKIPDSANGVKPFDAFYIRNADRAVLII